MSLAGLLNKHDQNRGQTVKNHSFYFTIIRRLRAKIQQFDFCTSPQKLLANPSYYLQKDVLKNGGYPL